MHRDPTQFRNRFKMWKEGKDVYEAGLPKFYEGEDAVRVGNYNVYPSAIGASELNVTTPEVIVTGTDRRPMYQRYDAENSTYDPDIIRNFTDWLPVIGDIGTSIDIKNAIKNQNYLEASLLGGMTVLPAPLAKGVNKAVRPLFNRTADKLYESFVKAGREDLALRMLDDKAKRLSPVTKNNGEIQILYRGDRGKYNIINEHSKNPVFLSTDKNYAEMYTSNRRFYTPDPEDELARQAVDLSDINPDNVREFYGFGNVFNAAPHQDINSAVAESFFNTNDYLISEKLADDVWDKYLPYFKEIHPDYDDFKRAVHAIRLKKPIPDDIPKSIYDDALRATAVENVNKRQATDFIRMGRYSGNNKKNPNGYFRKKDSGKMPKYDGTIQSLVNQDSWYEHSFDPKKINPLRTIKYDGLSGRDIPLSNEVDFWRKSKGREFAFRKSNNVKLRAITKDNEGKLIPLSKRLNLKNPDIRFFLPYLIGGGIGYNAFNKYAE